METIRGGKQQIVITEIPYEVNKANLVKKMDEFPSRPESGRYRRSKGMRPDRTGLRIVIELKKKQMQMESCIISYKNSDLQIAYNFNMVAIYKKTANIDEPA
ncbi:DNA gyrase subunit A [Peribacillus frigoritolerans]|nr:DNA gyrase subunit A [Peribacillus frigoritolerans]